MQRSLRGFFVYISGSNYSKNAIAAGLAMALCFIREYAIWALEAEKACKGWIVFIGSRAFKLIETSVTPALYKMSFISHGKGSRTKDCESLTALV